MPKKEQNIFPIKHTTDHSAEKIGTREDGTKYKYVNMPPMVSSLFRFAEDCVLKSSIKDEDEGKDFIIEMIKQGEKLARWMEEIICKNCRDEDDPSVHNCMADENFCVSNCDERVSTCICECNTDEILQIKKEMPMN